MLTEVICGYIRRDFSLWAYSCSLYSIKEFGELKIGLRDLNN
jgi:hypothetical protein